MRAIILIIFSDVISCVTVDSSQDSQSVTHSKGQKSQKSNEGNSISEDISEDIQEDIDISGDDDFLASSQEKVAFGVKFEEQ